MIITGYVSKIIYRLEETGYTVMTIETENDDVCCVGVMAVFDVGEFVEAEGEMTFHPQYGEQMKVHSVRAKDPTRAADMERYLASGAIKGIGASLAKRIVKMFGDDTFRIMDEEPELLQRVKGISEAGAMRIAEQFAKKRELREAIVFLEHFGVSEALAIKIYSAYGEKMYTVLRENPYKLCEDVKGVGFKTADNLALTMGIADISETRVRAGILYVLSNAAANGNVYLPEETLFENLESVIETEHETAAHELNELAAMRKVIIKDRGVRQVYLARFYYLELDVARMLVDLNCEFEISDKKIDDRIAGVTRDLDIELDELQKQAVTEAVKNGVFVLTGGPGTGKTTTINAIIRFFEREGMDVLLAAPTGRAAKRMTETVGKEAKTIHRLLEFQKKPSDDGTVSSVDFARNAANPLETDVMIIDEVSMVDITLMHALLKAIIVGTRVIFVGDVNQLPSVGPGNVLKDIIASGRFNKVCLKKIFRQAAESAIITNAHKINNGEAISLDNQKNRDFFFLENGDARAISEGIVYLVKSKISKFVNVPPTEVQVLTPMKSGELGCERLNEVLQDALNPEEKGKAQKIFENGQIFRVGDKVMQIKNNYSLEWEIRSVHGVILENGTGVFNGDTGIITDINFITETITVRFDEGRTVEYRFSDHDELMLSYAITIHKSQGSEYPAVILPLLSGPKMLFNRNVLYTAVTRAKKCVTIIGAANTVNFMINNIMEQKRFSGLENAIREVVK